MSDPRRDNDLVFVKIFLRDVILGHLVGVDFPSRLVAGLFHALHHIGLKCVAFFEQLVHALRIRASDVG